ncbi:glycosyltransferase [Asanoa sp. WMMD1127]|uniref:glycosyltransferase n=1 Tax=Asanoa sp. WMMD1127 TaxID=3016107 RepID=UPI0024166F25|nr:glycosyltransferase [Asanoa sp. WMMD1127]MDG4825803.1 glycosyltransferase [Asanoa sp. WMMD1127]
MISLVVPTLGRPSLRVLLDALAAQIGADPVEIILVDDRADGAALETGFRVLRGGGNGPAAARNVGWRAARGDWVVFVDDDVVPDPGWWARLRSDLKVPGDVGGVQARVSVPLPADRRPTDWERNTAGLADAPWITADMAYRRAALAEVGGFDERFPRAFREDADLAYRVRAAGWRLRRGERSITHPVRPADLWASVRVQAGNADDALLRRRYGADWRSLLEIPPGRRRRHAVVTGALAVGLAAATADRLRGGSGPLRAVAAAGGLVWAVGTAEFAARRVAAGPRTPREIAAMALTSVVIPPVAIGHWIRGWILAATRGEVVDVYFSSPRASAPGDGNHFDQCRSEAV